MQIYRFLTNSHLREISYFYAMKKTFWILFILFLAVACKKEAPIDSSASTDSLIVPADSISADSITVDSTLIQSLETAPALGKTILKKDENIVLYFDEQAKKGEVLFEGKAYAISEMSFSENTFRFKGPEISAVAENGDFDEMSTDCLYGLMPELKITLGNTSETKTLVAVQSCPVY